MTARDLFQEFEALAERIPAGQPTPLEQLRDRARRRARMRRFTAAASVAVLVAGVLTIGVLELTSTETPPPVVQDPASESSPAVSACQNRGPEAGASSDRGVTVDLFFRCERTQRVHPVERPVARVDAAQQGIQAAVEEMAAGPDVRERELGYRGVVPGADQYLRDVSYEPSTGRVTVEFDLAIQDLNNVGTTGVTLPFVDALAATVLQFPQADTLRLEIAGQCWNIEPVGACDFDRTWQMVSVQRPAWTAQITINDGQPITVREGDLIPTGFEQRDGVCHGVNVGVSMSHNSPSDNTGSGVRTTLTRDCDVLVTDIDATVTPNPGDPGPAGVRPSPTGLREITRDGVRLWVKVPRSDDGFFARVGGRAGYDPTTGCVYIEYDQTGDRAGVIWPAGTTLASTDPLVIDVPGAGSLRPGQHVFGGGAGYQGQGHPTAVADCFNDDIQHVISFNHNAELEVQREDP